MVARTRRRRRRGRNTRRASVSLPANLYIELEQIAKQKRVSFAWVIRDAAEDYIREKYPLLSQNP